MSKSTMPATFNNYNTANVKTETLPFHISAFGKKIGAKWFRQFMQTELFNPGMNVFSDKKIPDSQGGTGGKAYGFNGATGLAKNKGIGESSKNIESILYWSLAMYYDKWVWSTGNPVVPTAAAPAAPAAGQPAAPAAPAAPPAAPAAPPAAPAAPPAAPAAAPPAKRQDMGAPSTMVIRMWSSRPAVEVTGFSA